jgi:hypothetical protein
MALRYFDKYQNPELFQEFPPVAKEGFVLFNPISQDASKRWAGQNVPSWVLSLTQQEPLFMAYPKKRMVGGYRKRLMERGLLSALFDSYPDESQSITLYKVPAQNSQKQ